MPQTKPTSEQVTFLQAGTGATQRTALAKLRDTVSVKDFGAVGDGVADDTAEIQAAINASGVVYIPDGTYKITSSISLKSNLLIYGNGTSSKIQISADGVKAFSTGVSTGYSNIKISDLLINGGGQTTDIYTGYKGAYGVYLSGTTNAIVDNVHIEKMGIVNSANPLIDNPWGGYGIVVEARYGNIDNIRISNCVVSNIAGGGAVYGDGIYVAGYAPSVGTSFVDVVVSGCSVSTCGRHCYTVAGGAGTTIPSGISFVNCKASNSALDGIDIEEGLNVNIVGCTFKNCGNNQTYYNPAVLYGATFRLLAAIAMSNDSQNIYIDSCKFSGCYYGITDSGTNITISNSVFASSTTSDIYIGLASSSINMKLSNNIFGTNFPVLGSDNSLTSGFSATGCLFAGQVKLLGMKDGVFTSCIFNSGVKHFGTACTRNKFVSCVFNNFAGIGYENNLGGFSDSTVIDGCTFNGTGNMTHGIYVGYRSERLMKIINNTFIGCTTYGVYLTNGEGASVVSSISNNTFKSCAGGIFANQGTSDSNISSNVFSGVTSWCIDLNSISSGLNVKSTNISSNIADATCANGLQFVVSTGAFDYCILSTNNMHYCSATKWSVTAGQNANGLDVNNLKV